MGTCRICGKPIERGPTSSDGTAHRSCATKVAKLQKARDKAEKEEVRPRRPGGVWNIEDIQVQVVTDENRRDVIPANRRYHLAQYRNPFRLTIMDGWGLEEEKPIGDNIPRAMAEVNKLNGVNSNSELTPAQRAMAEAFAPPRLPSEAPQE